MKVSDLEHVPTSKPASEIKILVVKTKILYPPECEV
jgi:hypothetical protein